MAFEVTMSGFLFATDTIVHPTPVHAELARLFGLGPLAASLVLIVLTTAGTLLGRWLWALGLRYLDKTLYGGWHIKVSGGKSGRAWHMPLDTDIIRALKNGHFVTFKRDLGTILSGEGVLDFSLGVSQESPLSAAPPQASGLTINPGKRVIEMDFSPAGTKKRTI